MELADKILMLSRSEEVLETQSILAIYLNMKSKNK